MAAGMNCPLCGRDVPDLLDGLCPTCASERKTFLSVPDVLDVVRCAHCGRVRKGSVWVEAPNGNDGAARQALRDAVGLDQGLAVSAVDLDLNWEDERNATAKVRVEGTWEGQPAQRAAATRLRIKTSACPDCSRRFGGYFEAILQLRTTDVRPRAEALERMGASIEEELGRLADQGRKGAYFSRTDKVRGGLDYYVGSQEIARILGHSLADRGGAEYGESSKLVGRKDGADLYRVTILVRLPPYGPGDFVSLDGQPFKLLSFERKLMALWDLERGERVRREPKRFRSVSLIGTEADEKEAVVVSRHGTRLQLLDPDSLKTLDLDVPQVEEGVAAVRIFRFEGRVFVVPSQARAIYTRQ